MKESRYSEGQVAYALRMAESGTPGGRCVSADRDRRGHVLPLEEVRGLGCVRWAGAPQMRQENARLKRLVADLALDKQILQEVIRKKA